VRLSPSNVTKNKQKKKLKLTKKRWSS